MIDVFDILAFAVLTVLSATGLVIVVVLGMLPGRIAIQRGHPQAAAINAASWISLCTLGALWPLAFIWAFSRPMAPPPSGGASSNSAGGQA